MKLEIYSPKFFLVKSRTEPRYHGDYAKTDIHQILLI